MSKDFFEKNIAYIESLRGIYFSDGFVEKSIVGLDCFKGGEVNKSEAKVEIENYLIMLNGCLYHNVIFFHDISKCIAGISAWWVIFYKESNLKKVKYRECDYHEKFDTCIGDAINTVLCNGFDLKDERSVYNNYLNIIDYYIIIREYSIEYEKNSIGVLTPNLSLFFLVLLILKLN